MLREAYMEIETASALSTSWRAWGNRSMLSAFARWDGSIEHAALAPDDHIGRQAYENGYKALCAFEKAMAICTDALELEKDRLAGITPGAEISTTAAAAYAVNPIELARFSKSPLIERALTDDRMGLRYGILVYRLMTELAACHEAIVNRDIAAFQAHYAILSAAEDDAQTMCMPLTFHATHARMECRDVLTRTQIREPLRKMRYIAAMLKKDPALLLYKSSPKEREAQE